MSNFKIRKLQTDKPRRVVQLVKIGIVGLVGLFILEIWMASRLTTYGNKIQQLDQVKSKLSLENQLLEYQIAQQSSLKNLSQVATKLGFNQISVVEYYKPSSIASAF